MVLRTAPSAYGRPTGAWERPLKAVTAARREVHGGVHVALGLHGARRGGCGARLVTQLHLYEPPCLRCPCLDSQRLLHMET